MNWINVSEKLPPDNKYGEEVYLVSVICDFWKEPQTMVMNWECTKVRNKEVKRWRWNGSIKPDIWEVTHWMELPPPVVVYRLKD